MCRVFQTKIARLIPLSAISFAIFDPNSTTQQVFLLDFIFFDRPEKNYSFFFWFAVWVILITLTIGCRCDYIIILEFRYVLKFQVLRKPSSAREEEEWRGKKINSSNTFKRKTSPFLAFYACFVITRDNKLAMDLSNDDRFLQRQIKFLRSAMDGENNGKNVLNAMLQSTWWIECVFTSKFHLFDRINDHCASSSPNSVPTSSNQWTLNRFEKL